ncbi:alpha/beta hydrolase [Bifidobacterium amazonense]|uniref:Alpha/beta hydrolase n=1 Tax=Bifidobacterium amazonense TaxID=2809027 RepID=A0ABS9VU49_9BIFI|nr:alpha/beta hydrolase [Bifidobacterium amazonense]MCH9275622.1 alpha/beta hydrolase [Bifidobacterium amazonense]
MIHETLRLFDDRDATLTTYLHAESSQRDFQMHPRSAVIVLPGGAYSFLSDTEAEPVALTFLKEGYDTFVFDYTVGDDCRYPDVLIEVSKAILEVRRHADEWGIDPRRITLMGFSAGACIAGLSATQWNTPEIAEALGVQDDPELLRPDAIVFGYGAWDNSNTIQNNPEYHNPEAARIATSCTPQLDLINYVGPHVPPMFIWHTFGDRYVPVTNPLMIADAMFRLRIPVELHLFAYGEHGMSVCNSLSSYDDASYRLAEDSPNVASWTTMATDWMNRLFGLKPRIR